MLLTAPEWLEVDTDEVLASMRAVGTVVRLRVFRQCVGCWEWIAERGEKEARAGWSRNRAAAMHKARLAAHALAIPLYDSANVAHAPLSAETGVLAFRR